MYVNFEAKLAFLAHAKTASRATAQYLQDHAGFRPTTDHHQGPQGQVTRDSSADLERWEAEDPTSFTYVCTVRNHWDVWASWYVDAASHIRFPRFGEAFLEAFYELHPRLFPERRRLWAFAWGPWRNWGRLRVLRYEHLEEALTCLLRTFGLISGGDCVDLQVIGKTHARAPDYRMYYDAEGRALVANRYAEEIQRFGYRFEGGGEDDG